MDLKWYESFFRGIALDLWRKAVLPEQTRLEVDFLERELGLQPGARVLDVPCGQGRHTVELASRGFRVTGVDLSHEQMQEARENPAGASLAIEWREAEMRDLPWEAEFDAAFCFGNSFGYLDPDGTRAFIRAVSRTLVPGARFALDYGLAAECILPRLREREWAQIDDILFLEENRYDIAQSCIETTYTFVRGAETHTRAGLQWVHTVREVRQLLQEAGLEPRDLYQSVNREPFAIGSPLLVLVAEKT